MGAPAVRVRTLTDDELEELLARAAAQGAERALARAATAPSEPEWLDAAGAAALLGVHRDTLRRIGCPVHHVGRRVRYQRAELVAWMRAGGARKGA